MSASNLTSPIAGIENRTAQEVFDIMCDRILPAIEDVHNAHTLADIGNPITDKSQLDNTARNLVLNRTHTDLENIINGHDPEVGNLNNDIWDRLDKMALEIEALSAPSPRAQALEEGGLQELLERLDAGLEYEGWTETDGAPVELFDVEAAQDLFADAAAAIRALSSQPVEDGWLPIETAPTGNGSNRFLAYITGHGPCVCFRSSSGSVYSVDGRTILRATHWRPLPASPGASDTRPNGGSDE